MSRVQFRQGLSANRYPSTYEKQTSIHVCLERSLWKLLFPSSALSMVMKLLPLLVILTFSVLVDGSGSNCQAKLALSNTRVSVLRQKHVMPSFQLQAPRNQKKELWHFWVHSIKLWKSLLGVVMDPQYPKGDLNPEIGSAQSRPSWFLWDGGREKRLRWASYVPQYEFCQSGDHDEASAFQISTVSF